MFQRFLHVLALGLLVAGSSTCGGQEREFSRTRTKTLGAQERAASVSDGVRFGFRDKSEASAAPTSLRSMFAWEAPETWVELPSQPLRDINFSVAGSPDVECYLTYLQGAGGSELENINRWRKQMGYPPADPDVLDGIETRALFGRQATYVELEGTFTPRVGSEGKPDWMLVGVMLEAPGGGMFVKMTGPQELVRQEIPHFEEFCASLDVPPEHAGSSRSADSSAMQEPASPLAWDVPEGWTPQSRATGSMRAVTFYVGAESKTHCWVTVLGGVAGGLEGNVQRWAGEMGQTVAREEIDALSTLEVMGGEATYLHLDGDYTDSMGQRELAGATMLGLICPMGSSTIFVKMVGPSDEVGREVDRFREFCVSLRRSS